MSRIFRRTAFLPVLVLISILAPRASAKDQWISLTTKNFNIVSNASEGDTRKLALKLEQFHSVLATIFGLPRVRPIPTTVMVFHSDGSFRPYKPLYNGKPANVAGYFADGEDENFIALDISANEQRPLSVIYHEYTHLLTSTASHKWPLWLVEGTAELYSSFEVDQNKVTLGKVIPHHVYLLRDNKLIPLSSLFSVHSDSPIYNEREKQGIFYAESWALCHYFMFGDQTSRQSQMIQFTKLLGEGVEADKAFEQAFKSDKVAVEKALKQYVGRDAYSLTIYTLSSTQGEKDATVRSMTEAEALSYLGNLLARTKRLDEGEAAFNKALALDPGLSRAYEGLGFVALRRRNFDQALDYFKQASARGSMNYLTHFYYAQALEQENLNDLSPEMAAKIIEELRLAIKLQPGFAKSYYALSTVFLVTGEHLPEAAQLLETARRIEPQNPVFALGYAQVQVRLGDYAGGAKTLEPLLAEDSDPMVRTSAESVMRMIENYNRGLEMSRQAEAERSEDAKSKKESAEPIRRRPEASVPAPVSGQPTLKVDGAKLVRGVVAFVECQGEKWTLVVNTRDGELKFSVSDKEKLMISSQDPSFEPKLSCGSVVKTAWIYFTPATQKSKLAGVAVAVEFTQ